MYKLVKNEEATIRKHSESYSIKNYFTKDFSRDFSLAVAELNGDVHQATSSAISDRIYYVFDGTVKFAVDGKTVAVNSHDSIFIGKGTEYSFGGSCKMVLINIPAFGVEAK